MIMCAVNTMSPRLQNFQSSFAARLYWKMIWGGEGVEFAGTKALNGFAHTLNEHSQLSLVIGSNRIARGHHDNEASAHWGRW